MTALRLGSLFDGIGVFPLAAVRCGIEPVWASEIEKAPISITKRHFPDMAHLGDVTKLDGRDLPPVHIITFGSPCQNLSQIGNRTGLAGEILQKFTNYQIKAAVYGDYSRYTSKPLRDFIFESNRGGQFFFVATREEAIQKLRAAS